jgi:ElaB/YqjD/DUF883 family membrane-anchored ribosome-binding protein
MIRQRIDQTRSSLTEKLETLEAEVKDTVQGAKATVEDTIETVKASVQETVESVKRTFDIKYQVQQHPWPMVGGSMLTGFVVGRLFGSVQPGFWPALTSYREPESFGSSYMSRMGEEPARSEGDGSAAARAGAGAAPTAPTGMLNRVLQEFRPELDKVKGMAVGALLGLVRDLAKQAVPPTLAPQVEEIMNSVTTKLGGTPFQEPLIEPSGSTSGYRGAEPRTPRR